MAQMRLVNVLVLFWCFSAQANLNTDIIYDTVDFLQPRKAIMDHNKALALTQFASKVEKELDLDWRLAIAIIYQESSFQNDPQDCLKIRRRCTVDLGIGQINWKLWNEVFKIERLRLASDYKYALSVSFKILKHYKKRRGKRKNWHLYYHSGTPSKRKIYHKHLKTHYDKIRVYTRGYTDGQYDKRRVRRINNYKIKQRETVYFSYPKEFIRNIKRGCASILPPLQPIC